MNMRSVSAEQEEDELYKELSISPEDNGGVWKSKDEKALSPSGIQVQRRLLILSKLQGIEPIPHRFAAQVVQRVVNLNRAHRAPFGRYELTTIHGAKNREFDHVFVYWGYKIQGSEEKKRRLLYNAITRAKSTCTLLVQRLDVSIVEKDPTLCLLGQFQSALQSAKAKAGKV